jgi:hypothetical protein
MDLYRLGVKIFLNDRATVALPDFIPVFHRWVQSQVIRGHMLLDIHNYSHIHHGPGILLVGHEGNFSADAADGRPGLLYYRKHPSEPSKQDPVITVLEPALQACSLLEDESSLGPVRFRTDELLVTTNDRLHAPNDEAAFRELQSVTSAALGRFMNSQELTITRVSDSPKERLALHVRTGGSPGVKALLSKVQEVKRG